MEMISSEEPESWNDLGMDWENPDPRKASYVVALKNALKERFAVCQAGGLSEYIAMLSPHKTVLVQGLEALAYELENICPRFVNTEWTDYAEDYSDFPRMWTFRDLALSEGCEIWRYAKAGDLLAGGGAWLKSLRRALDKLHVIKCPRIWTTRMLRSGVAGYLPFEESLDSAFADAFDSDPRTRSFTYLPSDVYSWSSSVHWRCPNPNYDVDESNRDEYDSAANAAAYRVTRVRSYLAGRECDLLIKTAVRACPGPPVLADETSDSTFDPGGSGFSEGMNETRVHIADPTSVDFVFGDCETIPRVTAVPVSDFDGNASALLRRGSIRGYEGTATALIDYQCDNGFRFRAEGTDADWG